MPINAEMAMLYFRKEAKVQNLINNLRYNGKTDIGITLGNLLGERLKNSSTYNGIDLIIPVPLHQRKLRLRCYNQSTFITESQTKKSCYNLDENMKAVFKINNPENINGKHILLIDDDYDWSNFRSL